ncbi:MAG: hypothetical protein Q7R52_03495 [archaeon]|nr:hypothetical protein [archaeon]
MADSNCPKCKGTGVVKESNGMIHTCWDCLQKGEYDVHSKNIKESGVKI